MDGSATYNGFNIQTFSRSAKTGINLTKILHQDLPESVADLYTKANANDSTVPNQEFPSKIIRLTGSIHGSTATDLDQRIDAFKGLFVVRNKSLEIGYSGATRSYKIMMSNSIGIELLEKSNYANFSIELIAKGFGFDTSPTNLWTAKTAFTAATFTEAMTITGSAPVQYPVITIELNTITGDADYLLVSNDNNSQELLVFNVGLADGDVVVIDSAQRIVTVNGNEVDFYGTFLELEPGANSITYTDGFTTRNVDISGVYTKQWV